MNSKNILFILLLISIFILVLYATVFHVPCECTKENMENQPNSSCPDMLVKRGNVLMLYNSKKPTDSTNPIPFFNLVKTKFASGYFEISKKSSLFI